VERGLLDLVALLLPGGTTPPNPPEAPPGTPGERHHQEVVADRQVGEYPAPLGDQADPSAGQVPGGGPGQVAAAEQQPAGLHRVNPRGDPQRGCLARAVRAEQRYHLAGGDGQVHPVQDGDPVVARADAAQFQKRRGHRSPR
jgi:hypothetical protein